MYSPFVHPALLLLAPTQGFVHPNVGIKNYVCVQRTTSGRVGVSEKTATARGAS
jgi:hypothetical protein